MGLKENFERRGFGFLSFESASQAVDYLCDACAGETVAFGGSVTLTEIGLYDRLKERSDCFWHWKQDPADSVLSSEIYFTSANAVSETGELVNIDGNCNRVASTMFGRKQVYFVIGKNKLCPDLASAWDRARNVAGPRNAQRLNRNTPCAKDGKCHDCLSPECICSVIAVMRKKPTSCNVTVVLIQEDLGY